MKDVKIYKKDLLFFNVQYVYFLKDNKIIQAQIKIAKGRGMKRAGKPRNYFYITNQKELKWIHSTDKPPELMTILRRHGLKPYPYWRQRASRAKKPELI